VGAVVQAGTVAGYSSRGEGLVVVAPGGGQPGRDEGDSIYSSMPTYPTFGSRAAREGAGYGVLAGTSMAAPLVSAAAALVIASDPRLTPAQVRTRLASTAKDGGAAGWDAAYGYGEIDAAAAVRGKGDAGSLPR
jgi:subtilisin family serine protease